MDNQEIKTQLKEIENIKKIRELAAKITDVPVAMLTTLSASGSPRCRPMQTHHIKDDGIIWFITSAKSQKCAEIAGNSKVNVSYTVPADNLYISINGTASINKNAMKVDELWSEIFRAWFPMGKTDPDIALLKVDVAHVEYWDAPDSVVGQLISVVKATLKGNPYAVGEHKNVDL